MGHQGIINFLTMAAILILWIRFIFEVHQVNKLGYEDVVGISVIIAIIHLMPLLMVTYFIVVRLGDK